jgi:hypothetical protein
MAQVAQLPMAQKFPQVKAMAEADLAAVAASAEAAECSKAAEDRVAMTPVSKAAMAHRILLAETKRKVKATPHKDRLTALHVICLHLFRHISQKCSCIHKVCTPLFVSSDKKSDCASDAQSLCGVAQSILISK